MTIFSRLCVFGAFFAIVGFAAAATARVLPHSIESFPQGGGYLSTKAADAILAAAVTWDAKEGRMKVDPQKAQPSYCSGAVYLYILTALRDWDRAQPKRVISSKAWAALPPRENRDGEGVWGWANANGPGFAYLIHQLGAGYNFTSLAHAKPGDVLKIWWTSEIGGRERGHLVIYLGHDKQHIHYWSSNMAEGKIEGGFGKKSAPINKVKYMLFSRITKPQAFELAPQIGRSTWLAEDMLKRDVPWNEVLENCGITPSK